MNKENIKEIKKEFIERNSLYSKNSFWVSRNGSPAYAFDLDLVWNFFEPIISQAEKEAVGGFANGFIKLLKSLPEGDIYTVNPIILELKVHLQTYLSSIGKEKE